MVLYSYAHFEKVNDPTSLCVGDAVVLMSKHFKDAHFSRLFVKKWVMILMNPEAMPAFMA